MEMGINALPQYYTTVADHPSHKPVTPHRRPKKSAYPQVKEGLAPNSEQLSLPHLVPKF